MNITKAHFFDPQADAPWAAAPYGPEDQPKISRLLAEARIGPSSWVLEPGCGTGRLTAILADAVGPSGQVIALDIQRPRPVGQHRTRSPGKPMRQEAPWQARLEREVFRGVIK